MGTTQNITGPFSIDLVQSTVENCRYCLMCRHVTPVGYVTHRETLTPHGWGLLVASASRGLLDWSPATVDALYSASDGGNSRAHCVTDQPLPEAIAAMKAVIVVAGQAPAVVYDLAPRFEEWETPFASTKPAVAEGQGEYALFVGDEARYLHPQTLEAALGLLAALDIKPVLIGVGRNNGFLASSLGLLETSQKLARTNLAELVATGASRLLVLSPGDYFTFHQLYEERLGLPFPQEVELIELIPYLGRALGRRNIGFLRSEDGLPYAYLDPTHAVRVPERHAYPRALLEAVLGSGARELFWRKERAHPAGNTALQFTTPEIAEKLTRARLEDAASQGVVRLYCEDPGTLVHLERYAGEYNLEVSGLYQLLLEYLS